MSKLVEIFFPLFEYIKLIRNYINQRENYTLQNKSHRILPYLINFERFSLFIAFITLSILIFIDYFFSHEEKYDFLCVSFIILLITSLVFLYSGIKNKYYSFFYSLYYLIVFSLLFFLPHYFFGESGFEKDFVLIVSVILLQAFRSGKYSAIPVIAVLLIIFIVHHYQILINFNETGIFYLFFLIWVSALTVVFESILYYISLDYLELREKRDREKHELSLSRLVYNNFFPEFSGNERLKFYVWRSEHNQAGGDFYDVVQLREENMGVFFADISGHGVSSAVMAGALKMILQNMKYTEKINPEKMMSSLDKIFHKDYESHHASAVYIFFDFKEMKALLVNAGHPPVLYGEKGVKFKELETEGSILGYALKDPIAKQITIPIQPGDRFILYTDGLTDYLTDGHNVNVIENMEEIANQFSSEKSDVLIHKIPEHVATLSDFKAFRDDIVIGIVEVL